MFYTFFKNMIHFFVNTIDKFLYFMTTFNFYTEWLNGWLSPDFIKQFLEKKYYAFNSYLNSYFDKSIFIFQQQKEQVNLLLCFHISSKNLVSSIHFCFPYDKIHLTSNTVLAIGIDLLSIILRELLASEPELLFLLSLEFWKHTIFVDFVRS